MSTPTYNASGANGLTALSFANGGMGERLSATGNTVIVEVEEVEVHSQEYSTPGGAWVCQRTLGTGKRRVIWHVTLAAVSDAKLNEIERFIADYLYDGSAYALTDGFGRSTADATLRRDGTRREGRRIAAPGTRRLQRWRLAFDVLRPFSTATAL